MCGGVFTCAQSSQAVIRDVDVDYLTDESEVETYHTDPALFDTDGDGVGDGDEVLDATDPLDGKSSRNDTFLREDMGILGNQAQWPWYFARATGLLAFILLTCGAVFGLVMSSRIFQRIVSGAVAYELHRTLSFVALGAVLLHIGSLFLDDFINMHFLEAFVPGVFERSFSSALGFDMTLAVALGIAAFYFMLLLVVTAEFRAQLPQGIWRRTHFVSFVAYVLFVLHGFMVGTDSQETWVQVMYIVSCALVTTFVLIRIVSRTLFLKRQGEQKTVVTPDVSSKNSLPNL